MRGLESLVYVAALAAPSNALQISVCGDATYDLPMDRDVICASVSSPTPGTACPLKGDEASTDCYEKLSSYNGSTCVAPEDAVCALVTDTTWGCVFPSVACGEVSHATVAEEACSDQCETWEYDVDYPAPRSDAESVIDGITDHDATWFVQMTKVTALSACGTVKSTAEPTLEPTEAPTVNRADLWVPAPTPAPTLDHSLLERTPAPTSLSNDRSSSIIGDSRIGKARQPTSATVYASSDITTLNLGRRPADTTEPVMTLSAVEMTGTLSLSTKVVSTP
ncbi:unnamed protein product [Hyaloperonospora brassicae]|uniref:Uncharacterized protein n=1 Tax=Hyaloperonospora brassicae TaxID=162125 RepID=A0AAV0UUY6_HYABA|nr:unnamed protein product [Hyaloperonospora brassicae]